MICAKDLTRSLCRRRRATSQGRASAGVLLGLLTAALLLVAPATRADSRVDRIVVYKQERTMHLLSGGAIVRAYRVALGRQPQGHKLQRGDGRTPEGTYVLSRRNAQSRFHRSIGISYPDPWDVVQARRRGVSPGGDIMIHGLPNGIDVDAVGHPGLDWTNGCIAVTNAEIEEIWSLVDLGTTIEIRP